MATNPATRQMLKGLHEMQTRTLTDFLLARIAEDEAVANEVGVEEVLYGRASSLDACDFEGEMTGWIDIDPARVLAECEAKRRIVEECRYWIEEDGHYGITACQSILGHLALPYADHPDYRQEWKP